MGRIMKIAVDGPAGSGKSTVSKIIAEKLNIEYIDTGAMYRALTYFFIKNDMQFTAENAKKAEIDFKNRHIYLDGINVDAEIRTPEVNAAVSDVSKLSPIRRLMTDLQRKLANNKDVILDGRDIGSVVFPDADYKFFIDADVKTRAKRRYDEMPRENRPTLEEIEENIKNRDFTDKNRETAPLVKTKDAVVIDTTNLDIDGVVNKMLQFIKSKNV